MLAVGVLRWITPLGRSGRSPWPPSRATASIEPRMTSRQAFMLAALSAAERRSFTPVQVQKLFFLIDRNVAKAIGGTQFDFHPYNYGPFDRAVYDELDRLSVGGSVTVLRENSWRSYSLTAEGQKVGEEYFQRLDAGVQDYVKRAASFVLSLDFTQLVSAIYRAYPDMKANSVFQG